MFPFCRPVPWAPPPHPHKTPNPGMTLPFADDPEAKKHVEQASRSNKE
ncbi:CcoQ/FixQ family Cbb3-type cytochrome c oxidase assembly chaperone [Pseudomonas aeruginosa]